jgi:protein-disulfide isomerase
MASRAEQKAAARAAREQRQAELKMAAARRTRLMITAGVIGLAVMILVVAIVVSTSGGKKKNSNLNGNQKAHTVSVVQKELAGIPQSGNVLGDPKAPVTLTEYGDLVCPICRDFAVSTEPQIISQLVRTGKAKLVFRGFETASATANNAMYAATQIAARSAGLQGLEWNYVLLTYRQQPQTINGQPAETVSYVTTKYLQDLAAQVPHLNLVKWQSHLADQTLANAVTADGQAAQAAGAQGTPTVVVTGKSGRSAIDNESIPTVAGIEATMASVS